MAIKGKSRTKSKPKQVARAPRHEPVVVKPPLLMRRWVQVTLAFVAGVLALMVLIWATNNLRQDKHTSDAASAAQSSGAAKRTAGLAWQTEVEGALAKMGIQNPTLTPVLFADMNTAIDTMVKHNTVPHKAVETFQSAATDAASFVKTLSPFDLATTISGKGFDTGEAEYFTESKDRLTYAIQTYQRAAEAALLAAKAPTPALRKALTAHADNLRSDANTEFQTAWSIYQSALGSAGIGPKSPATAGG